MLVLFRIDCQADPYDDSAPQLAPFALSVGMRTFARLVKPRGGCRGACWAERLLFGPSLHSSSSVAVGLGLGFRGRLVCGFEVVVVKEDRRTLYT